MDDKKAEVAGAPADQPKPSSAVSTDGGSKSESIAAKESAPGPASSGGLNGAAAKAPAQKATGDGDSDQSLGTFLIAARERRGLTAEDVVRETRLPAHYLRMMESNDYSEISDQLYLLPFLRRYATFLELDQEDVAMRFVREVQRSDSIPTPARLDQPLVAEPRRHRGWTGAILVVGLLAVAAGLYVYESDRHRQGNPNNLAPQASAGAVTGSEGGATSIVPPAPASH